jgi:hypothetical protein
MAARRTDLGGWGKGKLTGARPSMSMKLGIGNQRRQAGVEVGGASGRVGEHRGIALELVDVQVAPDGGQSRLSAWRPPGGGGTEGN